MGRITAAVCWILGLSAVVAAAQPPVLNPRPVLPGAGQLAPASPARPPHVSLTPAELDVIRQRFTAYRTQLLSDTPRAADLIRAGLSEMIDAVEQASGTPPGKIGPMHVGVLTRLPTRPVVAVDPAAEAGARANLYARLGRAPSSAELQTEIAEFDARIARMNDALALRRTDIARSMRSDGQFPRALERRILGVSAAEAPSDPEYEEAALQVLIRALLLDEAPARRPSAPGIGAPGPSTSSDSPPARSELERRAR